MEFKEVIKIRHSCRNYSNDGINNEILNEIINAGLSAPSAQNRQPWQYIVIKDRELKKKIAFHSIIGATNFFLLDAPVLIVACGNIDKSLSFNGHDYYLVDVAISFQQMMLMGWNYGIGSCWLAAFDEKLIKKLLDLPPSYRVVGLSPFGYPKDKNFYSKIVSFLAHSNKRKSLSEVVKFI